MSKSHKKPSGDQSKAPAPVKSSKPKKAAGPDNSLVADVLETAMLQMKAEDKILQLNGSAIEDKQMADNGFDPDQFNFAEDGDLKQQEMALPGLREKHKETNEYALHEDAKAFVKGEDDEHEVSPNDVGQGSLGDCYMMAGMIAVARANPDAIKELIKDNGDGTFDVTLYIRTGWSGSPKPETITIDARLPEKYPGTPLYAKTGDKDEGGTELWAALIEKAMAQKRGSYDLISGGNIGKAENMKFAGMAEILTGEREGYMKTAGMAEDDALLHIAIALEDKKSVTCDSQNMEDNPTMSKEATKLNVYGNHAYAPESVDLDGRTISLTNPWRSNHVENLPVASFLKWYRAIRIGA
ncbi:MAG: hypothetical protein ACI9MC_000416 [Kiritimatiellia bacterium]|jgi:hypothetical protein